MEFVRLSDLLSFDTTLQVIGIGDPKITHLTEDSRSVVQGSLFFARPGSRDDGGRYVDEALSRGCVAVVTNAYRDDLSKEVIQLVTPNVAKLMGLIADRFYGSPSRDLLLIGVTGTSGKTSVTYWLRHFLEKLGARSGLLGTVEWVASSQPMAAQLTTPSSLKIHELMREMVDQGFVACVMEVSSHSLDQERTSGLDFDAAIFTNLTQEHLDYHKTMEAYGVAKKKLFRQVPLSILNNEDPFSNQIEPIGETILYGDGGDCFYKDEKIHAFGKAASIDLSSMAFFQISNILAAIATLVRLGYSLESLVELIPSFSGVPGRMEEVENDLGLRVVIDYAHKPDALEKVLQTLRKSTKSKLFVVFGCGGDRDRQKRPVMGAIAAKYADHIWITSDNPRTEDPLTIIKEVAAGCTKEYICEISRMQAIFSAIGSAQPGDTILIAGRGHERYQIIGTEGVPFHDASCARAAIRKNLISV